MTSSLTQGLDDFEDTCVVDSCFIMPAMEKSKGDKISFTIAARKNWQVMM